LSFRHTSTHVKRGSGEVEKILYGATNEVYYVKLIAVIKGIWEQSLVIYR